MYSVLYFHWQVSHCQGHSTSIAIQMPREIIPVDEIQKYHSWTDSLSRIHICSRSQNPSWRMELSMVMTWYPCGPFLHGGYHADSCEILLACAMSWQFPEGPTYIPCSCRHILYGTKNTNTKNTDSKDKDTKNTTTNKSTSQRAQPTTQLPLQQHPHPVLSQKIIVFTLAINLTLTVRSIYNPWHVSSLQTI